MPSLYSITSVIPMLISNNGIVTVNFATNFRAMETDWIGAFSPPNIDITSTLPLIYGYCASSETSSYLTTGLGSLSFNLTNVREGIRFYYFVNGTKVQAPVATSEIVNFINPNEPLRNRLIATGDQNIINLLWSSSNASTPTLQWGLNPYDLTNSYSANTSTIPRSQICGNPANTTGWHDLGLIHTASFVGITDMQLSSKTVYYRFGDFMTDNWSNVTTFHVPPQRGMQPLDRPTQVVLLADLGEGSMPSTSNTFMWSQTGAPSVNTSMSIGGLVEKGLVDAVFHSGDISYANGHLSTWDFFMNMISPISGGVIYLTTVGNHESDWPDTGSLPFISGIASGGECGVLATRLLPMPAPATTNQPWWSYDVGIIHFVGMSTEHNFTIGSVQYDWIARDLAAVNRTVTPWVVFSGHRSMYVDSADCCVDANPVTYSYDDGGCTVCEFGSDVNMMALLQKNIEPLLYKYKVNLMFSGHFHDTERQSAAYQGRVIQKATMITNSDGFDVDKPNATVHMIVGAAGAGPDPPSRFYPWSEANFTNVFGYAILTAVNATLLEWAFVDSGTDTVLDRMTLTQVAGSSWTDIDPNDVVTNSDASPSKATGWASLNRPEKITVLAGFCILAVGISVGFYRYYRTKQLSQEPVLLPTASLHSTGSSSE